MRLVFAVHVCFVAALNPVLAEAQITKCKTSFYDIEGDTSADLLTEMKTKNKTKGGHFAMTSYTYKINCQTLKTTCVVSLPRWQGRAESENEALNQKWDKFYDALVAHEQGHVDIFRAAMRPAKKAIQAMTCGAAQKHVKAEFAKQSATQKKFDAETKHGTLKGAFFGVANYLAMAYSPVDDALGYAYDQETQEAATERALAECNGKACKSLTWANGAKKCISLATSANKGYGSAWAEGRQAAEDKAMAGCNKRNKGCAIRATVCTGEGKVTP
ncbi:MAG: DUF922 domain-containing protein [Spirochaetes bacterium]|nr:DUF922 domain-containing protein [Spirochaetota bacterium]